MNRYFDNASTSYPKPEAVAHAMSDYLTHCGGTYGRASYGRVLQSTAAVEECRDMLARKCSIARAEHIFFTMNATQGANTILRGLNMERGCRVLVSPLEHNAVMRPLHHLAERGDIMVETLPCDECGMIDTARLAAIDTNGVALVVLNHMSNVNGTVQPVEAVSRWAHSVICSVADTVEVMVDCSQSLGSVEVDVDRWMADYMIFTGHKALHGPTGVGGFYARRPERLEPLIYGGTGSRSDSFDMPEVYPDRFEAGTPNMVGIIGLGAALGVDSVDGVDIRNHSREDFLLSLSRAEALEHITVHRPRKVADMGELFSVTHSHLPPSELARRLAVDFGIETRPGLHCSPAAHRTIGTFPQGTVRISPSRYHTVDDLNYLIHALEQI